MTKTQSGKTTATIPSDAPTSPPAPSHTTAPAGGEIAKKKDSREQITTLSARTRSQVAPKTRPAVGGKARATTPRDRAKNAGAHKITRRLPSVSAAREQTPEKQPNAPSAPPTIRKYPTQSAHYRLWEPGFIDVSPIPEEHTQATPTDSTTPARATGAMNLDAVAGLQADEL